MLETEKAWLACAIDGEGFISIYDRTNPTTGGRILNVTVAVCNTDLRFIQEAERLLGTKNRYAKTPDLGSLGRKTCYQVRLRDRSRVLAVLQEIRPYLIIKGAKADEAIALIASIVPYRIPDKRRAQQSEWMRAAWASGSFTGARGQTKRANK